MERDVGDNGTISVQLHFNPRAPHGARLGLRSNRGLYTHYFNPRAPHGARRTARSLRAQSPVISIHALRMERDL